jgi:hypothetical protein
MGDQKCFQNGLNGRYLPMQLTDWLLVELALLPIGVTQISLKKSDFLTTRL